MEYVCRFEAAGRIRREGSFIYQAPSRSPRFVGLLGGGFGWRKVVENLTLGVGVFLSNWKV